MKKDNSKQERDIKNREVTEPENLPVNEEDIDADDSMGEDNPLDKLSPAELEARKKDFETEAIPHMKILYNYALRMSGDQLEADDLVQDTYMRAFRFFHKFERGTNCKAWLFRIMKNCYINKYRKTKKEPSKVDYEDVLNFYDSIRDDVVDPNDLEH
ncbi:MAG TPA: sigma-70 family RNA polymerase sigma factor, partial [Ignavibacteria bacterium]|nr:sigma-70 family RNA polymerase sigma factor [Ignavibacteria bacterium]